MATVVRLGPVPLQLRRAARIAELERVFGTTVDLVEVSTLAALATALATPAVVGVAVDAAPPGELAQAIAAAQPLPVPRAPVERRPAGPLGASAPLLAHSGRRHPALA